MVDSKSHLPSNSSEKIKLDKTDLFDFSYISLEEWSQINSPYKLLEKQIEMFVEHTQNYINYMGQIFSVLGGNWLSFPGEEKIKEKTVKKHLPASASKIIKDELDATKEITKSVQRIAKKSSKEVSKIKPLAIKSKETIHKKKVKHP